VRDVCRAALHLALHPETDGESYITNDNGQTSTVEFLRIVSQITGRPFQELPSIPINFLKLNLFIAAALGRWRKKIFGGKPPKFEKDTVKYFGADYVCDNSKLRSTGFQFEYPTFESGLRDTVPWYLEHFKL